MFDKIFRWREDKTISGLWSSLWTLIVLRKTKNFVYNIHNILHIAMV